MTIRDKAIQICEAAAESIERSAKNYAQTAAELGLDVEYDLETDSGSGLDMDAVELAAYAWLKVDPELYGIVSSADPKRDSVAAQLLREGFDPDEEMS